MPIELRKVLSMTILDQIVASVRAAEARERQSLSFAQILEAARVRAFLPRRSLRMALMPDSARPRIIAEIKRASPSRGAIAPDLDPAGLARSYAAGGAAAISVLTEPEFFKGSVADLQAARAAVELPVLRKDFILSEYAVAASAAMGADAILLIVRLLEAEQLRELYEFAATLGLECLVEVYDAADLDKLADFAPRIVGINNRDLATFRTDLGTAAGLADKLPAGALPVALSGIAGPDDVAAGCAAGLTRFLIGEALVRSPDPTRLLQEMKGIACLRKKKV